MTEVKDQIIAFDDPILVTGGAGFIGSRVVANLLERGFQNVYCFTRRGQAELAKLSKVSGSTQAKFINGNLLSKEDCLKATDGIKVIYHLAAGTGQKSFADAFLNSVVTTRNLIEASLSHKCLKRFVSISSFAVYTNRDKKNGTLDETCPVESIPHLRGEAYCYAKVKQDELIMDYGRKRGLNYVLLRPGAVFGPGKRNITGRIGTAALGFFMHMGGGNRIPFTYVENCADAIVLAGLKPGIDGEIFNVVDDDLPTSRQFLRDYKRKVKKFRSVYLPPFGSYLFCYLWEWYANYSKGQLPPAYNRGSWHAYWKRTKYSNEKLKKLLGWKPAVSMADGLQRYFDDCRGEARSA